jgi:protein-disulfide isomerase
VATRTVIRVSAAVGALFSGFATALSIALATGLTPVMFFTQAPRWVSTRLVAGLPAEFIACAWFVLVAMVHGRPSASAVLRGPVTCAGAALVGGAGAWFIATQRLTWPIAVATAAAAIVLAVTAIDDSLWQRGMIRGAWADLRRFAANRESFRKAVVYSVAGLLAASGIHLLATTVPRRDAYESDLIRWYRDRSAKPPVAEDRTQLVNPNGVRLVIFRSYNWSLTGNAIIARARQVETFRGRGLPADVVMRDLPMDPACNPATGRAAAKGACEAAFAVRYLREARGDADAQTMSDWLTARATMLSSELVHHRLQELGLLDGYRARHDALRRAVDEDIALARRLGVDTAPRYFFNGIQVPPREDVFDALLNYELTQRTGRKNVRAGGGGGGFRPPDGGEAALPTLVSIAGAQLLGSDNARSVLIEFSDFLCSYCAEFATRSLPILRAKYIDKGQLQLAYLHDPLAPVRPAAATAAMAAECAGRQGKFWAVHDEFFRRPSEIDEQGVRRIAASVGVRVDGADGLAQCLGGSIRGTVADHAALAHRLGVRATPSFVLGSRERDGNVRVMYRFSGSGALPEIERALQALQ